MDAWNITVKRCACPDCCKNGPAYAVFDLAFDSAAPDDEAFVWKCRNCGELIPATGIEATGPAAVGGVMAAMLDNNGCIIEDN